ncbi:Uncharacterised protein [Salmonella enterica subsp. diarizonae]|nr:Uncharacterised protein [Salmonella enterica subsp. diarizonae]SUG59359.1 Uncharacterised protein [Salmonella enterica subsp. arizonae]
MTTQSSPVITDMTVCYSTWREMGHAVMLNAVCST